MIKSALGIKHTPLVVCLHADRNRNGSDSERDRVCFNNSYLDVKYMVCMQIRLDLQGTPLLLPRSHKIQQSDWPIEEPQ